MNAFLVALLLAPDVTPEKTVQSFIDAFNARDFTAMGRQVVGAKAGAFPAGLKMPDLKTAVGAVKIEGDGAIVEIDTEYPDRSRTLKFHETLRLRRENGDWRIVPAEVTENETFARQPFAAFVVLATRPEAFARAKPAAKKTVDLSNVKQIVTAAILYASDHDDRLPTSKGFKAAVMPYLRGAEIFTAPDAPKGTVSYFLDPRLSGAIMNSISSPAETAMILEGTPEKTAFPWDGKTPVGFADGHVKTVDRTIVFRARTIPLR